MFRKEKLEILLEVEEELKTIKMEKQELEDSKKFLQSETYKIYLNNGKIFTREKLIKGGNDGSAAIIMPITQNGEVVTVIEPRVFTKKTIGVGFPAGYIEKDEDIKVGALRELREETGYVPRKINYIDSFYQDEGCSSAYNHLFVALDCIKKYNQSLDSDEFIKYLTFNYEELLELEKMGYISGSNSKLLLAKTKQYFKR